MSALKKVFVIAWLLSLFPVARPLHAQRACASDDLQVLAKAVQTTQDEMLALKVEETNDNVPPSAQTLIRALKDQFVAVADRYFSCSLNELVSPESMQTALATLLHANPPPVPLQASPIPLRPSDGESFFEPTDHVFGRDLKVAVTRPGGAMSLLAVRLSFGIPCSDDNVLLVYSWRNGKWQRSVRWQSSNYKDISGAFGDTYQFVVLPGVEGRDWSLVIGHGTPWCSSMGSEYHLDVVAPDSGVNLNRAIFHKNIEFRRDEDAKLNAVGGGFEVRLLVSSIDPDIVTRTAIYRYVWSGSNLGRVQPVATNGRDFVDEWLQADWKETKNWSAPDNLKLLEDAHYSFQEFRKNPGSNFENYGPLTRCSETPDTFQVEIDEYAGPKMFFGIRQGQNSFTLLSESSTPDPKCTGGDLMDKR
jgi:hypothetical protein